MEFRDLHEFPKDHPPSPYGEPVPVPNGEGTLPEGLRLRTVGWLESPGFATGSIPKACLAALAEALHGHIFSDGYRGVQSCTLCGKTCPEITWALKRITLKGHGHYLVQRGQIVYMAPELLLHYILDHGYCPPPEFVDAVVHGRFLKPEDLVIRWREMGNCSNDCRIQGCDP
jgi:hypothetical protein